MPQDATPPSARQLELLEAAYDYVLSHGLVGLSLRPLAVAIGSSPRVLVFLFGNKDGLVRALLARARADELALLEDLKAAADSGSVSLADAAQRTWTWLADDRHRPVLRLWVEAYGQSLIQPDGPWAGFARDTVDEWLGLLASFQPESVREQPTAATERTLALAVLRGGLLDLVATGDRQRVDRAVAAGLDRFRLGAGDGDAGA
jgi:AcrR family transcriptional regulator